MADMEKIHGCDETRDNYARAYFDLRGHLPLILHEECYEFFGDFVKVVNANVFGDINDAEVTIESRLGAVHTLEFSELGWKHGRNTMKQLQTSPHLKVG